MAVDQSFMHTLAPLVLASILTAWLMYDVKYGGYVSSSEYQTDGLTKEEEILKVSQLSNRLHADMEKLQQLSNRLHTDMAKLQQQAVSIEEQLTKRQQEDEANMKLFFKQIIDEALLIRQEQILNETSHDKPSNENKTEDSQDVSGPTSSQTSWTSTIFTFLFRVYLGIVLLVFVRSTYDGLRDKNEDKVLFNLLYMIAIVCYAVRCGV